MRTKYKAVNNGYKNPRREGVLLANKRVKRATQLQAKRGERSSGAGKNHVCKPKLSATKLPVKDPHGR